ncbi:transposase [Actinoplanes sp. N902-109]|nr:transposase [Actinoplanes sp. N902-109]
MAPRGKDARAYSTLANRQALRDKPIATRLRKGRNGGGPAVFDPTVHERRNQIGRGFNLRKLWRGPATRYD